MTPPTPEPTVLERLLPARVARFVAGRPELRRVLFNVNWLAVDRAFDVVVGLVVGVLIARLLGPERYGMIKYLLALTALAASMAGMGLPNLLVRGLVDERAAHGELMGTALVIRGVATLVSMGACVALLPVLRDGEPQLLPLLWMLAIARLLALPGIVQAWFQARVESKYVVIARISVVLVFAIAKVAILLLGLPLAHFVAALAVEIVVQALALWGVYRARSGVSLAQLRFRREVAGALLREGFPLMLTGLMNLVYLRMDQVMLGQMAGDRETGIYAVAATITGMTYALPGFVAWSVFPGMVRLREIDEAAYRARLRALYGVMWWVGVGTATAISVLAAPVVPLVFGEPYRAAAGVLALQTWALVFFFSGSIGHKHLIATRSSGQLLVMTAVGASVNLTVNLALIPTMGALGAAIGTVSAFAVSHCLSTLLFRDTRFLAGMQLRALWPGNVARDLRALEDPAPAD